MAKQRGKFIVLSFSDCDVVSRVKFTSTTRRFVSNKGKLFFYLTCYIAIAERYYKFIIGDNKSISNKFIVRLLVPQNFLKL